MRNLEDSSKKNKKKDNNLLIVGITYVSPNHEQSHFLRKIDQHELHRFRLRPIWRIQEIPQEIGAVEYFG